MEVNVAAGLGRGPTELSAFDAALAGAGVADYNLVTVSSVLPADSHVRVVDSVPDLGPAGGRLTTVLAETAAPPTGTADGAAARPVAPADDPDLVAGLGWATGPGPGLFYEATGETTAAVRERLRRGLDAGAGLRDWTLPDRETLLAPAARAADAHVAAVVVAAYGTTERIGGPPRGGGDRSV
ncbi:pyruvoyl-dependent arginine decarboxylase [Halobaculum sp. MBLA0143]|uniref:pyruvoyl-dependent arginine decarboxylase n=1 Tax=Halobaculum sp. MBLA0143 TaxID=3079933 RepID=UPI003523AA11